MNSIKYLLTGVVLILLNLNTNACTGLTGSVAKIVCLADSLKGTLTAAQTTGLQLPYSYTNSQTWSNLPVTMQARLGIKIGTLNSAQLAIAKLIVQEISGTTVNEGNDEANQLLLADAFLSSNGGGTAYGSGQYYLCFNGTPTLTGLFSVKFGGHHLQIENTYNNGVMVGGTPHFVALEPLSFTSGATTYTTMAQEKNALSAMFSTLNSTQLATAHLTSTFTDILMGAKNNGAYKDWIFPATKLGLKVGTLTLAQKNMVLDAIKTYVLDIDDTNANAIINQYTQDLDETYIAYSGNSTLNTQNDYVRIDGPGVWIEFTVQPGIVISGVHYHSIWRDHTRDYGGAGSAAGLQTTSVGTSGTTGITEIDNIQFLKSYPNPTSDNVTIQFSLIQATSSLKLNIIDVQGKTVYSNEITQIQQGENSILINLANLHKGLYQIILEAERNRYSTKIVKE